MELVLFRTHAVIAPDFPRDFAEVIHRGKAGDLRRRFDATGNCVLLVASRDEGLDGGPYLFGRKDFLDSRKERFLVRSNGTPIAFRGPNQLLVEPQSIDCCECFCKRSDVRIRGCFIRCPIAVGFDLYGVII